VRTGGVNAKPRQHRPITTRPHLAPCFYRFIVRVQIRPSNLHLQETYLNFDGCERQRTVVVVAMAPPCRFWQQGNCRNGSMLSPCQAHPLSIASHTRHAPRSFIFLTLFTSLTWRCPFVAKLSSYPCFFFFCLSVCLCIRLSAFLRPTTLTVPSRLLQIRAHRPFWWWWRWW
jgi:hypothetical protein